MVRANSNVESTGSLIAAAQRVSGELAQRRQLLAQELAAIDAALGAETPHAVLAEKPGAIVLPAAPKRAASAAHKPVAKATRKSSGRRVPSAKRREEVLRVVIAHPGIGVSAIAKELGLNDSGGIRTGIVDALRRMVGKGLVARKGPERAGKYYPTESGENTRGTQAPRAKRESAASMRSTRRTRIVEAVKSSPGMGSGQIASTLGVSARDKIERTRICAALYDLVIENRIRRAGNEGAFVYFPSGPGDGPPVPRSSRNRVRTIGNRRSPREETLARRTKIVEMVKARPEGLGAAEIYAPFAGREAVNLWRDVLKLVKSGQLKRSGDPGSYRYSV